LNEALLVRGELSEREDLLYTVPSNLDPDGEEVDIGSKLTPDLVSSIRVGVQVHVTWGNDSFLALQRLDDQTGKFVAGLSHAECRASSSVFGLDDFIATELNAMGQRFDVGFGYAAWEGWFGLREDRKDGHAGVTTEDGNFDCRSKREVVENLGEESGGSDDVEGGYTEESLGIKGATLLQNLGDNRDCRVDGVGDHKDKCFRAPLGDTLGQCSYNACIDLEQVIASHSWLSGYTSRDDDDFGPLKGVSKLFLLNKTEDFCRRRDVGEIGGNARSRDNIVEAELSDMWVDLEEKRKGLARNCRSTGPFSNSRYYQS